MKKWQQMLLIGLIMTAAMTNVFARGHDTTRGHNRANSATNAISQQQAMAIAQRHFRGRVLAINRAGNQYRIKILSDRGSVHAVSIDAQTGAVISTR
ncbi:hypothetical protein Nstercoris_00260 [Nitrosomonas stercoris]|uniref:PepSY domain-containing protein n=1 Tax=Nitrosomonas stercoris TaxID=1444684 RepID=A0A4Y1YLY1_9PROT|nr:hypothetical protein Nstercoris_00260 [Nitrosomonas stercoris]